MSRKPNAERIAEYDRLWRFCSLGMEWLGQHAEPEMKKIFVTPLPDLWRNGHPFSECLSGVKQAAGDMLGLTRDLSAEDLQNGDQFLASRCAPTITEMRREIWRLIPVILKRQRIRNDQEYYLLKERVIDQAPELNDSELVLAARLLSDYEAAQSS